MVVGAPNPVPMPAVAGAEDVRLTEAAATEPSPPSVAVADSHSSLLPPPAERDSSESLRGLLDGLTAGERHAECCICFDDLCNDEPLSCFMHGGTRTCAHFFHEDCAQDVLHSADPLCPLCRRPVDALMRVPDVTADPDAWFRCVDVEGDGHLSRMQVLSVLVSQFPVDQAKLEQALPSLWQRWDINQSGRVSRHEFVDAERGLLAFVRRELLHERASLRTPSERPSPLAPAAASPARAPSSPATPRPPWVRHEPTPEQDAWADDPATWFAIYDENQNGLLTHDELLRALVRSNRRLSLEGARHTISVLELASPDAGETITLARFLEIHGTLQLATTQQEDHALHTLMLMLEGVEGGGAIGREQAAAALWEENGILSRAVMRLQRG